MKSKLTSRKFIVAIVSILSGILGILNFSDTVIGVVTSASLIVFPAISYMIVEGAVDMAGVKTIVNTIANALDELKVESKNEDEKKEYTEPRSEEDVL